MAVDSQSYTAKQTIIPFTTNLKDPARLSSSEPWGRLVHREPGGDDVTLDGSGAGDTARLRLFFNLPDNFVCRLLNARLTIYNTDITIADSYAELYLLPGPPPNDVGLATLVNQTLVKSFGSTSVGDVETNSNFVLGGSGSSSSGGGTVTPIQQYTGLPLFYGDGSTSSGMVWNLASSMDTQPAGTFSYWAEWLLYTVQQAEHSTLHWPVPVT